MESVLDVEVSCFANYRVADNPKPVNLLRWLTSNQYAERVSTIRATTDKDQRNAIKATLPAITPSGLFTRRETAALVQHSGLICLDIDRKGNEHIGRFETLRNEISRLTNVAYAGLSVSGDGLFIIIPIMYPDNHTSQFNELRQIVGGLGIRVDATPDVCRLRGYSYDPDAYFNHKAIPFTGLYKPLVIPASRKSFSSTSSEDNALRYCTRLIEQAPDGERHDRLYKAALLAGGYIAGGFIREELAIEGIESITCQWPNFIKSQKTIRDGIRYGKQRPITK